MKTGSLLHKQLALTAFVVWGVLLLAVFFIRATPFGQESLTNFSPFGVVAYADDGNDGSDGSDGNDGSDGASGDGSDTGGDNGGSDDGNGSGAADGGGCGDCGGGTTDGPTTDTPGDFGDGSGSTPVIAYIAPQWTPYCTGADDPNGKPWQWWEKTINVNPIQYRFVRMGDGSCTPPVQPQMTGSVSAVVGACVPGITTKRRVDVSWHTSNAQITVAQSAGGQYGGGVNLVPPSSNNSGSLTLELSAGAYVFAVAGHNDSWVTLQNVHRVITVDDCTPQKPVTWTPYCTGADDPNGKYWQWWEKSDTNPIQYRFLRMGDGSCTPPVHPQCPVGTTGTYPDCVQPKCPAGTVGVYPDCKIPKPECPPGTVGTYPDCRPIHEPKDDYPECRIWISDTSIRYGDKVTLSWSSDNTRSGWINEIGNVGTHGSLRVYPTETTTYKGHFVGRNGDTVTCSARVSVRDTYDYNPPTHYPPYYPPTYNNPLPYVTLSSVPYTGLDLGPYGTVIYWSLLILWCLFSAYLLIVKRVQNKMGRWFSVVLFGSAGAAAHESSAEAHSASASHAEPHAPQSDSIDDFIAQQLKLVQK